MDTFRSAGKLSPVALSAWLVWLAGMSMLHAEERPLRWALPSAPQATVLELRFDEPDRLPSPAALTITRDGSFLVRADGTNGPVTGRLSPGELHSLLHEVIVDHRLCDLTTDGLAAAIEAEGRRTHKEWRIERASTTVIRLALADGTHEVRCTSPELLRTRFPEVEELTRVCAVLRRLQNIMAVACVGGEKEAARLAALAVEELRRERISEVTVTPRDLLYVRGDRSDLRQCQFVVDPPAAEGSPMQSVHISVFETAGEPVRISITTLPQRQ